MTLVTSGETAYVVKDFWIVNRPLGTVCRAMDVVVGDEHAKVSPWIHGWLYSGWKTYETAISSC